MSAAQGKGRAGLANAPARAPWFSDSGVELIAAERKRQVAEEGWTPEHDDKEHTLGELAAAGACYALVQTRWRDSSALVGGFLIRNILWPWEPEWFRPAEYGDPPYSRTVHDELAIKNLVKAGALLAAEIDRIQRRAAHSQAKATE